MSVLGSRIATLAVTTFILVGIFASSGNLQAGVTKIAPLEAEAGHPFTIIDTSQRRLVDGSVAIFRLGALEVQLPLKTHKPFNTAKGRLASDMYGGLYLVFIRQPDESEFEVGGFTVFGEVAPPPSVSYEFNESIKVTSIIGAGGGSIALADTAGAIFSLWLPAGAVSADTTFSLTQVESIPSFLPGFRVLTAVRMQPSGSTFSPAANLSIDLPYGIRSGKPAFGFVSADDGSNLTFTPLSGANLVDVTFSDYSVQMPIRHFSVAGVAEADVTAEFPPSPPGADAETRTLNAISERLLEILANDGDLVGDPEILELLLDWLDNPADGLNVRAGLEELYPDSSSLERLNLLVDEANRLLLNAYQHFEDPEADDFDNAVLSTVAPLIAAHLEVLKSTACTTNTQEAQYNLRVLDIAIISGFVNGDLQEIFEDEVFACQYETIFTLPLQGVFTSDTAILDYQILQQDGTFFPGSLDDLQLNYDVTPENGTILSNSPRVTAESVDIGPSTVSVTIEDGPTSTADILWVPSFIGGYQGFAGGIADGCRDPGDEGEGDGQFTASVMGQSLVLASATSAVISVGLSGDYGMAAIATMDFVTIDVGSASGSFTGSLTYSYLELDEGSVYQVEGEGSFSGSVDATSTVRSATVEQYSGTSNWCTNYAGMAQLVSQ